MSKMTQIAVGVTALRREPRDDAPIDTQLLYGEHFVVDENRDGWVRGRALRDGYRGWVRAHVLAVLERDATHRVTALRTYVYSKPDLKSEPRHLISMNAQIDAGKSQGRFIETQDGGWVFAGHLAAFDSFEPDFVAVAERFVGTPYFWGGRDSRGLDCSGLVQTAFAAAGVNVPRDSGDQEKALSERWICIDPASPKKRGDLVFWAGHVGIMVDETRFIHANATFMETTIETLSDAEARIEPLYGAIRSVIRPAFD